MKLEMKKSPTETSTKEQFVIDHPEENEDVLPGNYAVRISGLENAEVQLSIDGGPWQGCRTSVGHYWYDWQPTKPGQYRFKARIYRNKKWKESDQRVCTVVTPPAA